METAHTVPTLHLAFGRVEVDGPGREAVGNGKPDLFHHGRRRRCAVHETEMREERWLLRAPERIASRGVKGEQLRPRLDAEGERAEVAVAQLWSDESNREWVRHAHHVLGPRDDAFCRPRQTGEQRRVRVDERTTGAAAR